MENYAKLARETWGALIGSKSNQFDQEKVLLYILEQTIKLEKERLLREVYIMCEPKPSGKANKYYNLGIRDGVILIRNAVVKLLK